MKSFHSMKKVSKNEDRMQDEEENSDSEKRLYENDKTQFQ